jgi:hypothetical protein
MSLPGLCADQISGDEEVTRNPEELSWSALSDDHRGCRSGP